MILYLIAWQGNLDRPDYDASKVLEGETEPETIAEIQRFIGGDRTLLIQELTDTIPPWRKQLAAYEEKGKTEDYWKRIAEANRQRVVQLEAMLHWAHSTSAPVRAEDKALLRQD